MKRHEMFSIGFAFFYVSFTSGYMLGKQIEFRKKQEIIKSRREIEEKLKSL